MPRPRALYASVWMVLAAACGSTIDLASSSGTTSGGGSHGSTASSAASSSSSSSTSGCPPSTCAQLGKNCGPVSDGCGGTIECGACPPCENDAGDPCGATGTPNVCGCTCPTKTCAQQGFDCGMASDGCGGVIDCGRCLNGQVCGLGQPNVCGGCGCCPKTCAQQGYDCGVQTDGCSATIDCGACPAGQVCGGGGRAGACGPVDAGTDGGP